jgi:hypothetical protein
MQMKKRLGQIEQENAKGITWCWNIDGDCQMADNRVHHPGNTFACIGWLIPLGGITARTAWNLGFAD